MIFLFDVQLRNKYDDDDDDDDLCWQTVPRPRRCHRKGAVAKLLHDESAAPAA